MVTSADPPAIDDERQLRLLAGIVRDQAIYLLDAAGRVSAWNDGARRFEGYEADEIIGQPFSRFFTPQDRIAELPEQALRLARENGRYEAEGWRVRKSGERYWAEVIIEPTRDRNGVLSGFAHVARDAGRRRQALLEAEKTRSLFEAVVENIPAPLVVKDAADGRFILINRAGEELLGVVRADHLGKTGHDVFPRAQADRFAQEDRDVLRSGKLKVIDEEDVVIPNKGIRTLRTKKLGIRNADGSHYLLAISDDVTERKRTLTALTDALARAEAANVAKGEFLANMSHELRTPLNGVLGVADALARTGLAPAQSHMLELMRASASSLNTLLCDILDLARVESGDMPLHPEPFDPSAALRTAAELFAAAAHAKGLDFRIRLDPELPARLVGDSLRIRQVVSSLIDNAVKFTASGAVLVDVAAQAGLDGRARLEVTVRDSGPGMTAETRTKLFDRFQQGDGSATRYANGAGLGLSIARNLARLMGGDVLCESRPGKGSAFTFTVRLPIDADAPAIQPPKATAEAPRSAPAPDFRPKVLLAEDHPTNQKVVQMMLGKAVDLAIASDGREAVEAVRVQRYDLILMDSQMPVMDGLAAMKEIRQIEAGLGRPRTPIISITANAMAHQVEASLAAGADYHLSKPISLQGLLQTVRRALEEAEDSNAEGVARSVGQRA